MRAIVLDQQRSIDDSPLELRDVPFPEPGPRQIRIKVHCCGLCHTDLHIVEGDLPPHKLPVVPIVCAEYRLAIVSGFMDSALRRIS